EAGTVGPNGRTPSRTACAPVRADSSTVPPTRSPVSPASAAAGAPITAKASIAPAIVRCLCFMSSSSEQILEESLDPAEQVLPRSNRVVTEVLRAIRHPVGDVGEESRQIVDVVVADQTERRFAGGAGGISDQGISGRHASDVYQGKRLAEALVEGIAERTGHPRVPEPCRAD